MTMVRLIWRNCVFLQRRLTRALNSERTSSYANFLIRLYEKATINHAAIADSNNFHFTNVKTISMVRV